MFKSRKAVVRLLGRADRGGLQTSKKLNTFVAVWLFTIFVIFCAGMTQRYWRVLRSWEDLHHVTVALGAPAYEYSSLLLTASRYLVAVNADTASQLFYISMIFGFAKAFASVHRDISAAIRRIPEQLPDILRQELTVLRLLQSSVRDFNDTFGHLILLNCVRDMIAVIGVIASVLQVYGGKSANESDAEHADRVDKQMRRAYGDWTIILITLANAALRLGVCLFCNANVKRVVRILQRLRIETESPETEEVCTAILSEIDTSTGSVSAAGLFYIDLGYVTKVFEIFVAYGVVVYQTRGATTGAHLSIEPGDVQQEIQSVKGFAEKELAFLAQLLQG